MKIFIKALLAIFLVGIIVNSVPAQGNISESIVKIYTDYSKYDYDMPWQIYSQNRRTGSGCIISGKRVLTSAHVVADQTFVQVKRAGQGKKYTAEVEVVAHDCDLAVLRIKDDSFFAGAYPLAMGTLPMLRDKVTVYGFPIGGDELCVTEGIVSRVEHIKYYHSGALLLGVQIDAAINPGSSGGPVIKNGKIVGVSIQVDPDLENAGEIVPVTIINHFLKDISDGNYNGIPSLEINWEDTENASLRSKYHIKGLQTGVLVKYIPPESPVAGILQVDDVILSLDGVQVDSDGSIRFRGHEMTYFEHVVHNKFIGDKVRCQILRAGKIIDTTIKLTAPIGACRLVPYQQYDEAPTYYIVGGLVFQPLTGNFCGMWKEKAKIPVILAKYYLQGEQTEDRKQVIVLTKVLGCELTAGYEDSCYTVISQVNGKKFPSMVDFVKAVENGEEEYLVLGDELKDKIILERSKVKEENIKILKKYKIDSDRSNDLKGISEKR